MVSIPVISREMRVAARAPATYRLRLLVGLIGIVVLWIALVEKGTGSNSGVVHLNELHSAVMVVLVILTPLMTADLLSKEKREGTLDLLFLSSLTPLQVVSAKFTTALMRVTSIWAIMIPISVVAVLAGGVTLKEIGLLSAIEFTAILLGLLAGLLSSAVCKRALASMLLSLSFVVLFLWLDVQMMRKAGFWAKTPQTLTPETLIVANLGIVLLLTPLLLWIVTRIAARSRTKEGPSARAAWLRKIFLTPRFWRSRFNRMMSRRMDRNPLIWLEYRTAWSRVGRGVLIGMLLLLESLFLMFNIGRVSEFHRNTAMVLLGLLAITASLSFQREKENGAFELLLVAPFTEKSLISGRLRAVWSYYTPVWITLGALVLLANTLGIQWYSDHYYYFNNRETFWEGVAGLATIVGSFVTIPIVGLYLALRLKHVIPILLTTVFIGFIVPLFTAVFVRGIFWYIGHAADSIWLHAIFNLVEERLYSGAILACGFHVLLAMTFASAIHRRLKARQFA